MKKFRIKVKKEFLDLETGLIRKPGFIMSVTENRYNEINRTGKGYIEIVKDAAPVAAPKIDKAETIKK